jgi:hypothetical protein
MATPDKTALEALWDNVIGETLIIYTASNSAVDTYGEKTRTYSGGINAVGRLHIIEANEVNAEFGYLQPGDAIALLKLTATIAQDDRVGYNSITYEVRGIVQKKTHLEVALKRLP